MEALGIIAFTVSLCASLILIDQLFLPDKKTTKITTYVVLRVEEGEVNDTGRRIATSNYEQAVQEVMKRPDEQLIVVPMERWEAR